MDQITDHDMVSVLRNFAARVNVAGMNFSTRRAPQSSENNELKVTMSQKLNLCELEDFFENELVRICQANAPSFLFGKPLVKPKSARIFKNWHKGLVRFQYPMDVDEIMRLQEEQHGHFETVQFGRITVEPTIPQVWKGELVLKLKSLTGGEFIRGEYHCHSRELLQRNTQPDEVVLRHGSLEVKSTVEGLVYQVRFLAHNIAAISYSSRELFVHCLHPPPVFIDNSLLQRPKRVVKQEYCYSVYWLAFTELNEVWMEAWIRKVVPNAKLSMPTNADYSAPNQFESFDEFVNLHRETRYLLMVVVTNGIVYRKDISREFLCALQELPEHLQHHFLKVYLYSLKRPNDNDKTNHHPSSDSPPMVLLQEWNRSLKKNESLSLPEADYDREKYALLKRITITPTRTIYGLSEVETSCRFTRNYKQYHESFARVRFTDEDLSKDIQWDSFCDIRIKGTLTDGVPLGSEKFSFFAYGSSQMKEKTCLMAIEDEHVNCAQIRSELGRFENLGSESAFVARFGQVLSDTRATVEVRDIEVDIIDDVFVKAEDGTKLVFSDGVGRISKTFASEVAKKLGLPYVPSAFQFRYAGYKGMLTVCDDDFMGGLKLQLRPSQHKFDSDTRVLEICSWTKYKPAFLNRQAIALFTHRNIDYAVFEKFMDDMLHLQDRAFENWVVALNTLSRYHSGASTVVPLRAIIAKDERLLSDKCVQTLLRTHHRQLIRDVEKKARIYVPDPTDSDAHVRNSALLRGVMDELGVLEPDEVFIQICVDEESDENAHSHIVQGPVYITKNPATHPGDLRKFKAVDKLELRHLKNALVFSQKGIRPKPDQISGGDLDGDQYACYWHPALLPRDNDPDPFTPPRLERTRKSNINEEDLVKHFCDCVKNDRLGMLCNLHLAFLENRGKLDCHECLELCEEIALALDFPKTGIPPRSEIDLKFSSLQWDQYPVFLNPQGMDYETPLCRLYQRACKKRKAFDKGVTTDKQVVRNDMEWYRKHFTVAGAEEFEDEAHELLSVYLQWWEILCRQFRGNRNESMVLLGFFDKKDRARKVIPHHVDWMVKLVQKLAAKVHKGDEMRKKKFLSALLLTCYDPERNPPERRNGKPASFQRALALPWIVDSSTLLKIFEENA